MKWKEYILASLLGFVPTLIFYLLNDPISWYWSILMGLITVLLTWLSLWIYSKNKKLGISVMIVLTIIYLTYIYLLFALNQGFISEFR